MPETVYESLLARYERMLLTGQVRPADRPIQITSKGEAGITLGYSRLRTRAVAWAVSGPEPERDEAEAAALAEALRSLYQSAYNPEAAELGNWWHWEIGAPRALLDVCVLLRSRLSPTDLTDYLATVERFCPDPDRRVSPVNGPDYGETGANRADKCMIVALSALLAGDAERLVMARDGLSKLFVYATSGDGFYEDGSFIQHDNVAYTGSYGVVLLTAVAEILVLLDGSSWQVTDPGVALIFDAVERSFLPFLFEGRMMDAVRGRAIARQFSRDSDAGAAALAAIRLVETVAPEPFELTRPRGHFVFEAMDRVVHHQDDWAAALALSSPRVARCEIGNGENLHGWYTGDGMLYVYLVNDPDHYGDDFWPTVDPHRLPGTTMGAPGASKSWFFLDGAIAAVGAGVTADGGPVETIVENRNLHADTARRLVVDGVARDPDLGVVREFKDVRWVHLEGVGGYLFPGGADLKSLREVRSGTWRDINTGPSTAGDATVVQRVFHALWIDHGVSPRDETYSYVLLPGATEKETADAYFL